MSSLTPCKLFFVFSAVALAQGPIKSSRLVLPDTTSSNTGVIYKGSSPFIHNFHHPTGRNAVPEGQNLFIGINAGNFTMGSTADNTWESSYNTAVGIWSLSNNTTGYRNTALGTWSLYSNTTRLQDTALGTWSLYNNTTGTENTAVGIWSLSNNTTGYRNTAIGLSAGGSLADGSSPNQTSNNSVYLGAATKALADGDTNEIVIGYNATGAGSNTVTLGNTAITLTVLRGQVQLGTEARWASGTEGTCNASNRGRVVMVYGGAGVADTFRVCVKDATDTYAWKTLY